MTTALIATQGILATRARVAWIGRHAIDLDRVLSSAGHEATEFVDWSALQAAVGEGGFDLIACDATSAMGADAVSGTAVPIMFVGSAESAPPGMLVVSPAGIEEAGGAIVALAHRVGQLGRQLRDIDHLVRGIHSGQALVGNSPVIRRLMGTLSRAADCDATVLIEGPLGSGKSLASRIVHCKSRRVGQRMVVLESANVTVEALAKATASARGSTLVLEDVERLPAATQAQLVRTLKERVAANPTAARLVVTTAAHLPELVTRGAFREDLYYRLHAFPIVIPALRERVEDIATIARAILDSGAQASGRPHHGLTPAAQVLLETMPWPGNVTQLEAVVRRGQALAGGGPVEREHVLPAPVSTHEASPTVARVELVEREGESLGEDAIRPFEEEEQRLLTRALRATKGNVRRAAQLLGIGRATLYRKIQQYKLRLQ